MSIIISDVSNNWIESFKFNTIIILSSILEHEEKMSVMHSQIQRHSNCTIDEIRSKDLLEIHIGFRRFDIKPIYSENNLNCGKHKFLRKLPLEGQCVASFYAPITYIPSTVLLFKLNEQV